VLLYRKVKGELIDNELEKRGNQVSVLQRYKRCSTRRFRSIATSTTRELPR
jgi:hypothetical protein